MEGFGIPLFDAYDAVFGNPELYAKRVRSYLGKDGKVHTDTLENNHGQISRNGKAINNRADPRIVKCDNYPPMNMWDKDGTLYAKLLVADMDEEKIGIDYKDLTINVDYVPGEEKEDEDVQWFCRGIKDKEWHTSINIDPRLYDPNKISYKIKDGILLITVAANKDWVQPKVLKGVKVEVQKAEEPQEPDSTDEKSEE